MDYSLWGSIQDSNEVNSFKCQGNLIDVEKQNEWNAHGIQTEGIQILNISMASNRSPSTVREKLSHDKDGLIQKKYIRIWRGP